LINVQLFELILSDVWNRITVF